MIPRRFRILRPYIASFVHARFKRPPLHEIIRWLFQPGKESRASKFIQSEAAVDRFHQIKFRCHDSPFYYPIEASWIDLCQTIDECFNAKNWHYFISEPTRIEPTDIVLDCGAAEGLFSFAAAPLAKKIFAIEPVPSWHEPLEKTFARFDNVEICKVGAAHKTGLIRMTNDEIYSRVSAKGNLLIQVATLDSMFFDNDIPVTFIKADVEGFEFPLLLGAENLIRKNRPKVSMTVYHNENNFLEIEEFLKNIHNDYRFKTTGIAENGNPVLFQAY